ncbi:5383_t:CDS:2, partial [Diversispora eburnea]
LLSEASASSIIRFTDSGYMKENLFQMYINHFINLIPPVHLVFLILDGHKSHPSEILFAKLKKEYNKRYDELYSSSEIDDILLETDEEALETDEKILETDNKISQPTYIYFTRASIIEKTELLEEKIITLKEEIVTLKEENKSLKEEILLLKRSNSSIQEELQIFKSPDTCPIEACAEISYSSTFTIH